MIAVNVVVSPTAGQPCITQQTLLRLAGHLSHAEAEKLAIHLQVENNYITALRQQYPDDPVLYAYKLMLKWWENFDEEGEEEEKEALRKLAGALRIAGLGSIATMLMTADVEPEGIVPLYRYFLLLLNALFRLSILFTSQGKEILIRLFNHS